MGGHAVYLDQQNGAMGKREDVADFGANLSCWVDAIVARVMDHNTLVELQKAAKPYLLLIHFVTYITHAKHWLIT